MTLTTTQRAVLEHVKRQGARTTRRLVDEYGPKPHWMVLQRERWLTAYETLYGQVMGLGPQARSHYAALGVAVPYLAAPASVTDRAYQNDAIEHLKQQGYEVVDWQHKAQAKTFGQPGRTTTDHIVRHVLRVPELQLRSIEWAIRGPSHYPAYQVLTRKGNEAVPGYPSLYATVAHGGLTLAGIKRLLHRHKGDIDRWRAPLIIAVPDERPFRSYLRTAEQKALRDHEEVHRSSRTPTSVHLVPRVLLIELPLPGQSVE